MDSDIGSPDDIEALKAALVAEKVRAAQAEAELAIARAKASDDQALIAHQQLKAGPSPGDVGFTCATIALSAARRRRRQCSTTRGIAPASRASISL